MSIDSKIESIMGLISMHATASINARVTYLGTGRIDVVEAVELCGKIRDELDALVSIARTEGKHQ